MRSFLPLHRFLSAYYYSCTSCHSCTSRAYAHFSQSGNTAIKVFTACIFQFKSVRHYVNTIMFAAIMSFITLFMCLYRYSCGLDSAINRLLRTIFRTISLLLGAFALCSYRNLVLGTSLWWFPENQFLPLAVFLVAFAPAAGTLKRITVKSLYTAFTYINNR